MGKSHFFQKSELVKILNSVIDKTLGEVDTKHVFNKTIGKPSASVENHLITKKTKL